MPISDIFKRQPRREARINAAEYEAVHGRPAPAEVVSPPKAKRDPVAEMDAARDRAFGAPKHGPMKKRK